MTRSINFCMVGFGNVGIRFTELLIEKEAQLREEYGCSVRLTGVCTRSKGTLINHDGIDLKDLLGMNERLGRFDPESENFVDCDTSEMITSSGADLMIELSTISIEDGQPATGYIERALNAGMHVITANKGPEAWHFRRITELADKVDRQFLYETIVMDGTPVFNLVKDTLHGNRILGIKGILNGTTNFVLDQLEKGTPYEDAIKEAQRIQLAEADPSMDVDGWDGAAKICSLANILMDAGLNPTMAKVTSIASVTPEDIRKARENNRKIKYLCLAERNETTGQVELTVEPRQVTLDDPLSNVNGTSAAITLYTDLAGEVSIVQTDPGILQTAYGVYSDLITLIKSIN